MQLRALMSIGLLSAATVATVALLSMSGGILGALVAAWNEGRSQ